VSGHGIRLAAILAAAALAAACSTAPGRHPAPSATALPGAGATPTASATPGAVASTPRTQPSNPYPDHVLIVVFENKAFSQLDGSGRAPYLNALMARSAVYTDFHAETHPSQPNYIALFSGDTHGVTSDSCPVRLHGTPNLGRQLLDTGRKRLDEDRDISSEVRTRVLENIAKAGLRRTRWTARQPACRARPYVALDHDMDSSGRTSRCATVGVS